MRTQSINSQNYYKSNLVNKRQPHFGLKAIFIDCPKCDIPRLMNLLGGGTPSTLKKPKLPPLTLKEQLLARIRAITTPEIYRHHFHGPQIIKVTNLPDSLRKLGDSETSLQVRICEDPDCLPNDAPKGILVQALTPKTKYDGVFSSQINSEQFMDLARQALTIKRNTDRDWGFYRLTR